MMVYSFNEVLESEAALYLSLWFSEVASMMVYSFNVIIESEAALSLSS